MSSQNNEDQNPPMISNHNEDQNAPTTNSHGAHHLLKTSGRWLKRCDPHPCDNIVRQKINKLSFQITMNNIFHNIK